jgi:hypothetical protein
MNEIHKLVPRAGSYVWKTDYFSPNWQDSFGGDNYPRLRAVVGSDGWSADGFTRIG